MKRPLLDYFGGKWRMAPKIIKHFPEHKTFVDLMAGAGSITLRKPVSKNEIINDVHSEIYNLFYTLRHSVGELRELLVNTPYSREEYDKCREPSKDSLEQARRTIVKSWCGIGDSLDNETGFRVSLTQRGSVTAPWVSYIDFLEDYSLRLRRVILEKLDWRECIRRYDKPDTLFYADPPYVKSTRSNKHAYKHDWGDDDHIDLMDRLSSIKGMFVLSGYNSELYSSFDFNKVEFQTKNNANKNTVECLWIKS